MGKRRNTRLGNLPDPAERDQAARLRARGLSFRAIGQELGITKPAAWHLCRKVPRKHTPTVMCSACRHIVAARFFQQRTVGEVLCPACLAARPEAPFALRLHSLRLAGLTRRELERAAEIALGWVKKFEEVASKPQRRTRARLAQALGAPELEPRCRVLSRQTTRSPRRRRCLAPASIVG